jgi:hypothetical protein
MSSNPSTKTKLKIHKKIKWANTHKAFDTALLFNKYFLSTCCVSGIGHCKYVELLTVLLFELKSLTLAKQLLYHLNTPPAPLPHPFWCVSWLFFEIESQELFVWGWFWTVILLISASWAARFYRREPLGAPVDTQNLKLKKHLILLPFKNATLGETGTSERGGHKEKV